MKHITMHIRMSTVGLGIMPLAGGLCNVRGSELNKDATERRVHVLPTELLERIRAYQTASGIPSEVEAVRRLLDSALQMRDSVTDILDRVSVKYKDEMDFRVLARDVLVSHILVQDISISDFTLEFKLKNGARGSIDGFGSMQVARSEGDLLEEYPFTKKARAAPTAPTPALAQPSWESSKGDDLDDEIPF